MITITPQKLLELLCSEGAAAPCEAGNHDSHWEVGKDYGIRTVTMVYTGQLVAVTEKELVLIKAAWIPDTGRFHQFAAKGEISEEAEVEPYAPDQKVIIGRGALLDAFQFKSSIPTSQK